MSRELAVRNCQRALRLDLRLLRRSAQHLLDEELGLAAYELGVQFVSEHRMTELNRQFLRHEGPTDVITFDYRESEQRSPTRRDFLRSAGGAGPENGAPELHGEIFVCPAVAKAQSKQCQTSLKEELVRYIVHGVLHLRGFDDRTASSRKLMKREEARLLRRLEQRFKLTQLRTPFP